MGFTIPRCQQAHTSPTYAVVNEHGYALRADRHSVISSGIAWIGRRGESPYGPPLATGPPGGPPVTFRLAPGSAPRDPPSGAPQTPLPGGPGGPGRPYPALDPRGPKICQFLTPCGAKSWGSGGAPPTTLILLRNQWSRALPVARRTASVPGPRSDPPAPRRTGPAVAPPWLAGWLILRPLRGGWTKVAAAPFGVGDPRPGTGVPSRARSLV